MRKVTIETMADRITVIAPMPAPTPCAELMRMSMRPETLRPVAKNSAQIISATMPANILPIDWNIARPSLKTFFTSRDRMISMMTTPIQTIKSALTVSSLMEATTSLEKMMSSAIGKMGKTAYHFGAAG